MPDDKGRRTMGAIPVVEQPMRRSTGSFFATESGLRRLDPPYRDPRVASAYR